VSESAEQEKEAEGMKNGGKWKESGIVSYLAV